MQRCVTLVSLLSTILDIKDHLSCRPRPSLSLLRSKRYSQKPKKIVFHESYYDEFSFKLTWLQQNLSSTPGLTTQNHQQLISSKPIKIKALYIYTIYAFSYFNNRSIEVIVFSMCVLLDSLFIYIKAWP